MFVITNLLAEAQLLETFENDICLTLQSLLLPLLLVLLLLL